MRLASMTVAAVEDLLDNSHVDGMYPVGSSRGWSYTDGKHSDLPLSHLHHYAKKSENLDLLAEVVVRSHFAIEPHHLL